VEWLIPQAVMAALEGRWTFWEEYDLDKKTSYFCLVSSRLEEHERVYYDWVERREVFFIEDLKILLGAVSEAELFGLPTPMACFVSTLQCPPFLQESTRMGPVKSSILATVLVEYGRTWNPVGILHSSSI